MLRIGILNGPNLDRLGLREPGIYGSATLQSIMTNLKAYGQQKGTDVTDFQSAHEGALIDKIHEWTDAGYDGLLINAGAYSHTSIGIQDGLRASGLPAIEVHLSHVHGREAFRHHSAISAGCRGFVSGFGAMSYQLGLDGLLSIIEAS